MNAVPGKVPRASQNGHSEKMDPDTAAQVKAARSRSNSWFTQVKQREARLQAAEDKALQKEMARQEKLEAKRTAKEIKKNGFFGSTLRRLSSGGSRKSDRRDSSSSSIISTVSGSGSGFQNPRMTLNRNARRKRPSVSELHGTTMRRVCFQLDELVELRTYEQVEADTNGTGDAESGGYPTVQDMTSINPYASSSPLDRADLYLQCCRVYKSQPISEIVKQFRAKGPAHAPYEGPRRFELVGVTLTLTDTMALADCLGLPITGKHLTEVILSNCDLCDTSLQILLSCLYTSASIEKIEIQDNPGLTEVGIRFLICFLCLSPQIQHWGFSGYQFASSSCKTLTKVLSEDRIRALTVLHLSKCHLSNDDLAQLLPAARRSGVFGLGLQQCKLSSRDLHVLASMVSGPSAMRYVDLSGNDVDQSLDNFVDALDNSSPLVYLELKSCSLSPTTLTNLLSKLTILPNFRRLGLSGNNLKPVIRQLKDYLPRIPIIRRLDLSFSGLDSNDVLGLCDLLAEAKLSELILTGIPMNAATLSALHALARVSRTLANVEFDSPHDVQNENLERRIISACLQNMEQMEGSLDFTATDLQNAATAQQARLGESREPLDRNEDLHAGGVGVASALDYHLDNADLDTAGDMPLEMLERARHIRSSIEPALSEPLSELQRRRLTLVAETLDKVIRRFESTYTETQEDTATISQEHKPSEVFEHTGRARSEFIPPRKNTAGPKSRKLEEEEGEMMKLAHRMTTRLQILKSASASASASPSNGPSRGELAIQEEAQMLEKMNQADGDVLKRKLYDLQKSGFDRQLGNVIS